MPFKSRLTMGASSPPFNPLRAKALTRWNKILMSENIDFAPTGQIEVCAGRQEVETGLRKRRPALPGEHGVQRLLELVEVGHVAGGVGELLLGQVRRPPVGTLLVLGQIDAQKLFDEVLEAVAVGVSPDQLGGDLGAVDGGRRHAQIA